MHLPDTLTADDFASIKRVIFGGLLLYVLWLLAGNVFGFAAMMKRQQQEQQQTIRTIQENGEQQTRILRGNTDALARQNRERQDLARQNVARLQTSRPKLTAPVLADHLRRMNAFGLAADPQRRLSCVETRGDWDYTCRFHADPIAASSWVQFGVLVDAAHVLELSKAYPTGVSLPPPLNQAAR